MKPLLALSFLAGLWSVAPLAAVVAPVPPTGSAVPAIVEQGRTVSVEDIERSAAPDLDKLAAEFHSFVEKADIAYRRDRSVILENAAEQAYHARLLELEAHASRTTPDKVALRAAPPPVTDAQVRAMYDARRDIFFQGFQIEGPAIRSMLEEEAKERGNREFYARLAQIHHVQFAMPRWRDDVPATGPSRGPDDAPITVIEFADFQCPYCSGMRFTLERLLAIYPKQVRLVWRHLPLQNVHPDAVSAARASICADAQGKFWPLHDLMLHNQDKLNPRDVRLLVDEVGVKLDEFDQCFRSPETARRLESDIETANRYGFEATPTFFINGRPVVGAQTLERLRTVIEEELARPGAAARIAGASSSSGPSGH